MEEKKGRRRLMASWWNVMNRPDKLSPFFFDLSISARANNYFFFSLSHLSILTGVDGTMGVAGVVGRSVSSG
jgi:hypothetical protein